MVTVMNNVPLNSVCTDKERANQRLLFSSQNFLYGSKDIIGCYSCQESCFSQENTLYLPYKDTRSWKLTWQPAKPEPTAVAMAFLASDDASCPNGAILPVDNSWLAG